MKERVAAAGYLVGTYNGLERFVHNTATVHRISGIAIHDLLLPEWYDRKARRKSR